MDQLQLVFGDLRKLGALLDKEVPLLYKELENLDSLDAVDNANSHHGYYLVKDMENELQGYHENIDQVKSDVAEFDSFNKYVDNINELALELSGNLEKVVEHLKKYGYEPKKPVEEEKVKQVDDDVNIEEDNDDDKENSNPGIETTTPHKRIPVQDNDKTPDLADFGLAHLKECQLSLTRAQPAIIKPLNPVVKKEPKMAAPEVECTPAQFSHKGFEITPGLFGTTQIPKETPLNQNLVQYRFNNYEQSSYMATPESVDIKWAKPKQVNIMNKWKNNVKTCLQFDHDTTMDELNMKRVVANHRQDDLEDLPESPDITHHGISFQKTSKTIDNQVGMTTPTNITPTEPHLNCYNNKPTEYTPTEPLLKSVDHGLKCKSVKDNSDLSLLKSQLGFEDKRCDTPEEPQLTSVFNRLKINRHQYLQEQEDDVPQSPELTCTFQKPLVRMAPIPSIPSNRNYKKY